MRHNSELIEYNSRFAQSNVKDPAIVVNNDIVEPVTLDQAKAQLRVDFTDDDAIITRMITEAREAIESYCSVSIVGKTITVMIDLFKELEIPYGPVVAVTSFVDRNGNDITGFVKIYGTMFKYIKEIDRSFEDAKLIYTTGYTQVPNGLVAAILNELAYRYEHRGDEIELQKQIPGVCPSAGILADPYVRYAWR